MAVVLELQPTDEENHDPSADGHGFAKYLAKAVQYKRRDRYRYITIAKPVNSIAFQRVSPRIESSRSCLKFFLSSSVSHSSH